MTDHTAIIERMARAMDEVFSLPFDECPDDAKRNRLTMAQTALSASGLVEVLEKASALVNNDRWGTWQYMEGEQIEHDAHALRNAIKGVRDAGG